MNDLFNPQKGGIDKIYGWMGQIVDESHWNPNHANKEFKHKLHLKQDVAGFGYRYKVRIFGRDTQVKDVPDEQLEMAEVLLPVTAGSGHGGSSQTSNLRQGNYVWGFYKDGVDGSEPIIVGVLPNHSQTSLFGGDPEVGFTPRTGYKGLEREIPASTKNLNIEGGSPPYKENTQNQVTVANYDQNLDGKRGFLVPSTFKCEGPNGEIKGFQKTIKFTLAFIKRVRKESGNFLGAVSDLEGTVDSVIDFATDVLSGLVKSLFRKIRGFVVNKLNNGVKDLIDLLPPNFQPNAVDAQEKATDTLQCVFNKIISRLLSLVGDFLRDIIDKFVNAPLCAAESFIGNILSNVLGDLSSGISDALGFIDGILGSVGSFFGDILGSVFDALDFLTGILNFLSCDEELDCSMGDEWSFWDGANIDVESIGGDFGKKIKEFIDSNEDFEGNIIPSCNTSQIPCGPPILVSTGGGGSGLQGNVVVGIAGNILGIDITNPGSGYKKPPTIKVSDNCGTGNGAVLEVNLIPDTSFSDDGIPQTGLFSVGSISVVDPGVGYIQAPNGSTGGDGVLFSGRCDTIVDTTVHSPGKIIEVREGQTIFLPSGTNVEVYDSSGNVLQTLTGRGQLGGIPITRSGRITTPDCVDSDPNIPRFDGGGLGDITPSTPPSGIPSLPIKVNPSDGTYSVIPIIDDVSILNPGVNYNEGDTIEITPDNGAELQPVFGDNGELVDVIVVSGGNGFVDYPNIRLRSQTGVNAVISPIFKFKRIITDEDIFGIPPGTPVLNVIDCVGKIFPR